MKSLSRGYTLVELMVALVLGLLLVGAAFGVYESGRRSGHYSDALGRYQETVRYAQAVISDELRMAGYFGCFQVPVVTKGAGVIQKINELTSPTNVGVANNLGYTNPVFGVDGGTGGGAIPAHKGGTDVIQVQHASKVGGWLNANTNSAASETSVIGTPFLNAGDLAVLSSCRNASVFNVAGVNPTEFGFQINHPSLGQNYLARGQGFQGQLFAFQNHFLYVREVEGRSILTLRTMLGNGSFLDDDIAEGIEDLQFLYGYVQNPNTIPSANQLAFQPANQIPNTVAGWRSILSVKVCMLSVSSDKGLSTEHQTYTDCNGILATAPDSRLRFPISFTVNLRNRVQW